MYSTMSPLSSPSRDINVPNKGLLPVLVETPPTVASDASNAADDYGDQTPSPPRIHRSSHPSILKDMNFAGFHESLSIVQQAYGPNADLYKDVLHISSDASDKEIRAAYFRRGREVLQQPDGNSGSDTDNNDCHYVGDSVTSVAATSHRSKLQFRAISAAYDVVSNPNRRNRYDESVASGGILRKSLVGTGEGVGAKDRTRSNATVRWKDIETKFDKNLV